MISFARGAPALECLDTELLADCARAAIQGDATVLAYGPGGGYAPLRERLAAQHGVDPSRVLLTAGGLQGFVFYAEELLDARPGRVLVEAPTYDRPLKVLARLGADVRPLRMDQRVSIPTPSRTSCAPARRASSTRSPPSRTRAAGRCRRSGAGA